MIFPFPQNNLSYFRHRGNYIEDYHQRVTELASLIGYGRYPGGPLPGRSTAREVRCPQRTKSQ